jgi:hypothetical protein
MYHINDNKLKFKPDKDYSVKFFPNDLHDGYLLPYKITRSKIENGVELVTNHLIAGNITNLEARAYLKYLGINTHCQANIIMIATNTKKYNDSLHSKKKNKDVFQEVKNDKKNHPEKYEKFKLLSAWYGCHDLSIFVEVPMHLLMLGIMKSVMLKIGKWLRLMNQNTSFVTLISGKLHKIKGMNIEWCKILEYPTTEKFGGWVSENFSAMARLGIWFYSHLYFLPISDQYIDPTTIYTTWNKVECEKWLHVRGLSKKGKVIELKKIIGEYITNNNIPSIKKRNEIGVNDIMELVHTTSLMIQLMLSNATKRKDINRIEAIIRMFLIHFSKIDQGLKENLTPSWIQQYNILCLLNIPTIMRQYGSMRNLWEGGKDGEAYLKQVKSNLKSGLVHKWQSWVLNNLLREDIYDDWKMNNDANVRIRQLLKLYSTIEQARTVFDKGDPISSLLFNGHVYICYRNKGTIKGARIELLNETKLQFNQVYYSLLWTNEIVEVDNETDNWTGIILLPNPNDDNNEK